MEFHNPKSVEIATPKAHTRLDNDQDYWFIIGLIISSNTNREVIQVRGPSRFYFQVIKSAN